MKLKALVPVLLAAGGATLALAGTAQATTVDDVIWMIQNSGGRYVPAGASLSGADCSGLVSVAQSLAMGQTPHRIGNTTSLLAGRWTGAIPGASTSDQFVIGVNAGHMVARINGVNIESTTSGQPYRVGAAAASPWSGRFKLYHIDPSLLVNGYVAAPPLPGPAIEAVPVEAVSEAAPEVVEIPASDPPPLPPAEELPVPPVETLVSAEEVPAPVEPETLPPVDPPLA